MSCVCGDQPVLHREGAADPRGVRCNEANGDIIHWLLAVLMIGTLRFAAGRLNQCGRIQASLAC